MLVRQLITHMRINREHIIALATCLLSTARLFVCIGDCGSTPFEGGIPSNPHIKVCNHKFRMKNEPSGRPEVN